MADIIYSHGDVLEAAATASGVVSDLARNAGLTDLRLYPIPRGGVPAAYALLPFLQDRWSWGVYLVDAPEKCNVFVDDIVDSGRTRELFMSQYPNRIFVSLFLANDTKSWKVFPWEGEPLASAEDIPVRLLQYIGENPAREGLQETPKRFLRAWRDWTSGYHQRPADVLKAFKDGGEKVDEMVIVRAIPFYSTCEHHMAPIFGTADIAYIPNGWNAGLSKLSRVLDVFARRLQVQERLTTQVADALMEGLEPLGCGVIIRARHLCMESRGICKQGHETITSAVRGVLRDKAEARAEFMALLR